MGGVTPDQAEPRLDLGDLGPAHRDAVRRRPIELNHGAVTLLAYEGDIGDGHDVAAVDAHEQAGVELRFRFRDRPRAHAFPGAVMDPGVVRIGAYAAHLGGIDEMGAVGAL